MLDSLNLLLFIFYRFIFPLPYLNGNYDGYYFETYYVLFRFKIPKLVISIGNKKL